MAFNSDWIGVYRKPYLSDRLIEPEITFCLEAILIILDLVLCPTWHLTTPTKLLARRRRRRNSGQQRGFYDPPFGSCSLPLLALLRHGECL
jgi:hypothetical protein